MQAWKSLPANAQQIRDKQELRHCYSSSVQERSGKAQAALQIGMWYAAGVEETALVANCHSPSSDVPFHLNTLDNFPTMIYSINVLYVCVYFVYNVYHTHIQNILWTHEFMAECYSVMLSSQALHKLETRSKVEFTVYF